MLVSHSTVSWNADIVNYLVTEQMSDSWTKQERLCFLTRVKWFFWDEPYLFKYCLDQIIRRCIPDSEFRNVLSFRHDQAFCGHFSGKKTAAKILQCDFYWSTLFRDAHVYCQQGFKYWISGSYRMGVFISDIRYRGRYRGYARISGVHIKHYI